MSVAESAEGFDAWGDAAGAIVRTDTVSARHPPANRVVRRKKDLAVIRIACHKCLEACIARGPSASQVDRDAESSDQGLRSDLDVQDAVAIAGIEPPALRGRVEGRTSLVERLSTRPVNRDLL